MRGFRIGRVSGIDINIDWSWLVTFFLVVYSLAGYYFQYAYHGIGAQERWMLGVVAALLLFASVLAHELMHSVVARRYGMRIRGITLFIFGGVSQIEGEPGKPAVELSMAISGPLMSLALSAILYGILKVGGAPAGWPVALLALTQYLAVINLALGVFNLLPAFPLDGGRVLRAILWARLSDLELATRYASQIGQAFGYVLMAVGFLDLLTGSLFSALWLGMIGWFLAGAARSSYAALVARDALSGVAIERIMETDVPTVTSSLRVDEFVENYLMKNQHACYPVVDGDQVKGIVGIEDVRPLDKESWASTTVGDIAEKMDEDMTIEKGEDVWQAMQKLSNAPRCRLLVMDEGRLDGTITPDSMLRVMQIKTQLRK